jgi:hypothetical protein
MAPSTRDVLRPRQESREIWDSAPALRGKRSSSRQSHMRPARGTESSMKPLVDECHNRAPRFTVGAYSTSPTSS